MIKYKPKTTKIAIYEKYISDEHDVYFTLVGYLEDEKKAATLVEMLTKENERVMIELDSIRGDNISYSEKNKKYFEIKNKYFPNTRYHEFHLHAEITYSYEYVNELNMDKEIAIYELSK